MYKKTKYNSKKIVRYPNGYTKDYEELKSLALYSEMDKKKQKEWLEKVKENCIIFDSIKECEFYEHLLELEKEKVISNIRLQPVYVLQPALPELGILAITYKADFEYKEDGKKFAIDIKGFSVEVAKIKRKLFLYKFKDENIQLLWIAWANKSLGWLDYFENERRKARNRKVKKCSEK